MERHPAPRAAVIELRLETTGLGMTPPCRGWARRSNRHDPPRDTDGSAPFDQRQTAAIRPDAKVVRLGHLLGAPGSGMSIRRLCASIAPFALRKYNLGMVYPQPRRKFEKDCAKFRFAVRAGTTASMSVLRCRPSTRAYIRSARAWQTAGSGTSFSRIEGQPRLSGRSPRPIRLSLPHRSLETPAPVCVRSRPRDDLAKVEILTCQLPLQAWRNGWCGLRLCISASSVHTRCWPISFAEPDRLISADRGRG